MKTMQRPPHLKDQLEALDLSSDSWILPLDLLEVHPENRHIIEKVYALPFRGTMALFDLS